VSFLAVPWCYQSRNQGDLPGFLPSLYDERGCFFDDKKF